MASNSSDAWQKKFPLILLTAGSANSEFQIRFQNTPPSPRIVHRDDSKTICLRRFYSDCSAMHRAASGWRRTHGSRRQLYSNVSRGRISALLPDTEWCMPILPTTVILLWQNWPTEKNSGQQLLPGIPPVLAYRSILLWCGDERYGVKAVSRY